MPSLRDEEQEETDEEELHELSYVFKRVFARNIPKFGVQGTESVLTVSSVPSDTSYSDVLSMVYNVIERK